MDNIEQTLLNLFNDEKLVLGDDKSDNIGENIDKLNQSFPKNDEKNKLNDVSANPTESTNEDNRVSIGKFKTEKALLDAYNSLESEFTKRCQRLKELEAKLESAEKQIADNSKSQNTTPNSLDDIKKDEIIKEYLRDILSAKQKAIILGEEGVGVMPPNSKPKTFSEAGDLLKEMFSKKN